MEILELTKSKTREKILRLFFADLGKKYYLRQLERILDLPVGNIRRELLSLEKSGLFKREEMGRQVYYSLNKKSPIFEEFKKIVSKTIGLEGLFKKNLKKVLKIEFAFIYGSFARGKEDSFSDIDLMIIGNPDENELISKISELEGQLNREINYSIFSVEDFKKGLAKREIFLEEILKGSKIFIIGNQNDLENNSLQKKGISFEEVNKVLAKAYKFLRAAEFLLKKDVDESVFKEAYDAMILASRALMFSLGVRPRTVGAHTITISFCELYLDKEFKTLIEKFKKMKKKRNYLIYGAGLVISKTEAENALKTAREFIKKIKDTIQAKNPQKKLI